MVLPTEGTPGSIPSNDAIEQLTVIQGVYDYLPHSYGEVDEVMSMSDHLHRHVGVSQYLYEVYEQQRNEHGISAATNLVVDTTEQYAAYYTSSLTETQDLVALHRQFVELDNPQLTIEAALGMEQLGYGALVRYVDLSKLVRVFSATRESSAAKAEIPIDPLESDYSLSPPQEMVDYIRMRLESIFVGSVRQLAKDAVTDQLMRSTFWLGRLQELRSDSIVGSIAEAAITENE